MSDQQVIETEDGPKHYMPVYIERTGVEGSRQAMPAVLHHNLALLRQQGWSFPRVIMRMNVLGALWIEHDLTKKPWAHGGWSVEAKP